MPGGRRPQGLALLTKCLVSIAGNMRKRGAGPRLGWKRSPRTGCESLESLRRTDGLGGTGFQDVCEPALPLRLQDERDGILAEYALTALEKAYEFLGRDLGYRPGAPVRVEIFPITNDFTPPHPCRSATSKSPGRWVFANSIRSWCCLRVYCCGAIAG